MKAEGQRAEGQRAEGQSTFITRFHPFAFILHPFVQLALCSLPAYSVALQVRRVWSFSKKHGRSGARSAS